MVFCEICSAAVLSISLQVTFSAASGTAPHHQVQHTEAAMLLVSLDRMCGRPVHKGCALPAFSSERC